MANRNLEKVWEETWSFSNDSVVNKKHSLLLQSKLHSFWEGMNLEAAAYTLSLVLILLIFPCLFFSLLQAVRFLSAAPEKVKPQICVMS